MKHGIGWLRVFVDQTYRFKPITASGHWISAVTYMFGTFVEKSYMYSVLVLRVPITLANHCVRSQLTFGVASFHTAYFTKNKN